jgi:hypothetical protein
MVALAQRVLRFKLGGDGGGLLAEVLHEACACLRGICHHPDGKVRPAGCLLHPACREKRPVRGHIVASWPCHVLAITGNPWHLQTLLPFAHQVQVRLAGGIEGGWS